MAKYSYEFKKKVVMAYINAEGGKRFLANKYDVKSTRDIMKWVNAYKEFGDDGLVRSRSKKTYAFEFKLSVVELYLTTEVSYQELALSVGRIQIKRYSRGIKFSKGYIYVLAKSI